jgi:hypothetical protein
MDLRTSSIADRDTIEAALWLDQQKLGLGDDFVTAVRETFEQIKQMPLACPTLNFATTNFKYPLRWRVVGRFPHLAIFTVQANEILVVGILHPSRDLEAVLRSRVGVS